MHTGTPAYNTTEMRLGANPSSGPAYTTPLANLRGLYEARLS